MKVLCINNDPKDLSDVQLLSKLLKYGMVYTVLSDAVCTNPEPAYILKEVQLPDPRVGFTKSRFIPVSDIDETELVQHRELEKVRELCANKFD